MSVPGNHRARPAAAADRPVRVAYLVNQYPKLSHTFVRREILALEALGLSVSRFSVRPMRGPMPDAEDQREQRITRAILGGDAISLAMAMMLTALGHPLRLWRAVKLAVRMGRRSSRGVPVHLIYLAEACVLRRWLEADGAEHLHVHFGDNGAAVAMLCRVLGGPVYSFTVHGPGEFDHAPQLALDEKVRRAAFVVTISAFCRSQLFRWCDFADWPKVRVIGCGVDRRFLDSPTTPVPGAPRLVCVGRLCEAKAQVLLVRAAAALREEGVAFELVLAGGGPMRGEVEREVHRLGVTDCVTLTGDVSGERVRELIVGSRALVLPSFAEGLPVVLMEAMALGRPVVSTTVAAIGELVEPGVSGWLVPPSDLPRLIGAMREVLATSSERLSAMGRAGAEAVRRSHDIDTIAKELAQLFGATFSEPRPGPARDAVVGVVAIGRNEGARLVRCLDSLSGGADAVVYVDSGSSDGSVAMARGRGVETVELDMATPFTAARARNAGFERLMRVRPDVEFVQFLDGDCEVDPEWLATGSAELIRRTDVGIVCGRLRERHPDASIYNALCDIEWNGPVGEVAACGGNFMIRTATFREVGGFNPRVIAAEDDELCVRVRLGGAKVWRIEREMAWHDAAMTRFGQWWKRSVRAGHAFAQVGAMHGSGPVRHFRREVRSAWFWGAAVPAGIVAAGLVTHGWGLAGVLVYPAWVLRIRRQCIRRGMDRRLAWWYAGQCVLAKFPQTLGQLRYGWNRWRGVESRLIEHRDSPEERAVERVR